MYTRTTTPPRLEIQLLELLHDFEGCERAIYANVVYTHPSCLQELSRHSLCLVSHLIFPDAIHRKKFTSGYT